MVDYENHPQVQPVPSREVEKSEEHFVPVCDVWGRIEKIFTRVRNTDSLVLHAELDTVRVISEHTPGVQVIVEVDGSSQVWDVFLKKYPTQEARVRAMLEEKGIPNAITFVRTPEEKGVWARDMGIWADDGKTFVIPATPSAKGPYSSGQIRPTEVMVNNLRRALGVEKVIVTDISFEGGDYFPLDHRSFLGFSCAKGNEEKLQTIRSRTGKRVIELGNSDVSSPFPHLDSGVVFISNDDALVNDPEAMFILLRELNKGDWEDWRARIHDWYKDKPDRSGGLGRSEEQIQMDTLEDLRNIDNLGSFGYDAARRSLDHGAKQMRVIKDQLKLADIYRIMVPGIDMGFPLCTVNSIPDIVDGKRRLFLMELGCKISMTIY